MGQISFKIPDSELEFLRWYAEKKAQPLSTVYRNATFESFLEWKTLILLKEYQIGAIGFKRFCHLVNLSFHQATLLMQQNEIEPPISEIMDLYTSRIRDSLTVKEVFKAGKIPTRRSNTVEE